MNRRELLSCMRIYKIETGFTILPLGVTFPSGTVSEFICTFSELFKYNVMYPGLEDFIMDTPAYNEYADAEIDWNIDDE